MNNVLLLTDFSDNSRNAILYAINLFANKECNFYLYNVIKLSDVIANNANYSPDTRVIEKNYLKPTRQRIRHLLEKLKTRTKSNESHHFFVLVDFNFFLDAIRNQIKDKQIDFIVMGTKGASTFNRRILGSNAAEVITKIKCTTLVIPAKAKFHEIREIAFATDYSSFYRIGTLKPIISILKQFNSKLRILYINRHNIALLPDQITQKDNLKEFFSDIDHSFHELTNRKVEDAIQCFVDSRSTDMIAMVAKNLNYFQQILFHSKIKEISYHTEIPFLVLHDKS